MVFLDLDILNLPKDVIENSGDAINLVGELTGSDDEIVVITQLGRRVGSAHVCHLKDGFAYDSRPCKCIFDMPGFKKIEIRQNFLIKEFNSIKYTMACLAESGFADASANWLW